MENAVSNLAVTIPATQVENAGEPVFPVLRDYIRRYTGQKEMMLALIDQREQYGMGKYGQTLMSEDGRDTPTEITNEMLDMLAYLTKWAMQNENNTTIDYALRRAIAFVVDMVDIIQEEQS